LIKKTDTIYAKIGTSFGVQYILDSQIDKSIQLRQVWTFPNKMVNDKGKVFNNVDYTIKRPTNVSVGANYTIENDYELIKGKWIFQIYNGKKKLYQKEFYLE
jgi:hypothetical protein